MQTVHLGYPLCWCSSRANGIYTFWKYLYLFKKACATGVELCRYSNLNSLDIWGKHFKITDSVGQTLMPATFFMVHITLPGTRFQSGISVLSLQAGKSFEGTSLIGLPKAYLASIENLPQNIILLQNVMTLLNPVFCSLCCVSETDKTFSFLTKMRKTLLGQKLFKHLMVCMQRMLQLKHRRTLTRPSGRNIRKPCTI